MRRLLRPLIAALAAVAGLFAVMATTGAFGGSDGGVASAASPAQQIGMKVVLITAYTDPDCTPGHDPVGCGTAIAYGNWQNTLKREGVPYDTVVTNPAAVGSVALPTLSSTASDGTEVANYEGVIVAGSGDSGLSAAQWTTLQTFEQHFSVRQITAYAQPSSTLNATPEKDFGLTTSGGTFSATPAGTSLTAAGQGVFPYLKGVAFDSTTFGYSAAAGNGDQTLISDTNNDSLLGIYTSSDGRQAMYQTFNANQYMLQTQLLQHGELNWLTRDTYFGDQRNYLTTQIDDTFLSDDSFTPGTGIGGGATDYNPADALREQPADVTAAAKWSKANNFRIDMLYNGGGSTGASDPLLVAYKGTDPTTGKPYTGDFGWVSHTWDHPNLDQGCANQAYIDSEITKNTAWATGTLGLAANTDPTKVLGVENPGELVTGEHAGLANLLPGTPGTVDPPELNDPGQATTTTGGLPAGSYTYAITDQFSTTGGESSASTSAAVTVAAPVAPATGTTVTVTWDAVCHAAQYNVYREVTGSNAWYKVGTVAAQTTDFGDSGPSENLNIPDSGAGTAMPTGWAPPTVNNASESPYEQNPELVAAFTATGIKEFGSDASKPYPNPATATFTTGSPPSSQYAAGATFQDAGATAIPRHPTNIYYNVATSAQEVNEYETLYDDPTCTAIAGVTSCNPAGTQFTMSSIVNSIDFDSQGMFSRMMGNDPRPHYFHQTNLMQQQTGIPTTTGDGLYYQVMNPLLAQYNLYFQPNAPIEQPTMQATATLLSEQAAWATAGGSQVTGSIEGNLVTINNSGSAIQMPLTGIQGVGDMYGGNQSGWTNAKAGTSTFTALAAWPALPTTPAVPTGPSGTTPATGPRARGRAR